MQEDVNSTMNPAFSKGFLNVAVLIFIISQSMVVVSGSTDVVVKQTSCVVDVV